MSSSNPALHPGRWLRELTHLKPAQWHAMRAIRAALALGLPLAAGLAWGDITTGLWVAMGPLMLMTGDREAPYPTLFRLFAISAPLGALGYLAGYLSALPVPVVAVAMALVGCLAALISSYGAALSTGMLQLLLVASIAIGVPGIGPYWELSLLYLAGALWYMALLVIEAWWRRGLPERERLAQAVQALSDLAQCLAEGRAPDTARRQVTDQLAVLYQDVLHQRWQTPGRSPESDTGAAILQRLDAVFSALLAETDTQRLQAAASQCQRLARSMVIGASAARAAPDTASVTAPETAWDAAQDDALARAVHGLQAVLASAPVALAPIVSAPPATLARDWRLRLDAKAPGRAAWQAALALGLCLGVAYALHGLDHNPHWFWIPLTVGLIMKPDFGSVFARALQRCLGALGGVVIGAVILTLVPKGYLLILCMALLAAVLTWALQRSSVLQTLVVTPLILILVDIILPGSTQQDYAWLRLLDTVIGAVIVLVLGYLIWPRRQGQTLAEAFARARLAMADYLRQVLLADVSGGNGEPVLRNARRQAYGQLADLRAQLQKTMADPPPTGREAAAWFPLVAGAERVCDAITAYSQVATPGPVASAMLPLVDVVAGPAVVAMPAGLAPPAGSPEARLYQRVAEELAHGQSLVLADAR